MSRTIPAAVQTMLDSGLVKLATCLKITQKSSTVFGFTDWSTDLVVDGVTYKATGGYTPSDFASSSQLNVDNAEVTGYFDSTGVTLSDVRGGEFDNAAFRIFAVNPDNLADSPIAQVKLKSGWLGRFTLRETGYTAELRGLGQLLQQPVGSVVSASCRANLYDSECQVVQDPSAWQATTAYTENEDGDAGTGSIVKPTSQNGLYARCTVAGTSAGGEPSWPALGATVVDGTVTWTMIRANQQTGTLTSQTDRATFADTSRTEPDGWWENGTIEITSGTNNGVTREIKTFTQGSPVSGSFDTYLPFPYDLAGNETYIVVAGCRRDRSTDCITKFNNIKNMRAEPFTPGVDKVSEVPRVK